MKQYTTNNYITKFEKESIQGELANAVVASGQTLVAGASTVEDTDKNQLTRSICALGNRSALMTVQNNVPTGSIQLCPANNSVLLPTTYANLHGFTVAFTLSVQKSVAYTIQIGQTVGSLLSAKPLAIGTDGSVVEIGGVPVDRLIIATYYNTIGSGTWVLANNNTEDIGHYTLKLDANAADAGGALQGDVNENAVSEALSFAFPDATNGSMAYVRLKIRTGGNYYTGNGSAQTESWTCWVFRKISSTTWAQAGSDVVANITAWNNLET